MYIYIFYTGGPHPDPGPNRFDGSGFCAEPSSVRVFCAQNLQRQGRSLPREGRGSLFQWDLGISVGFFTETTGSLRNPKTRRTPSYDVNDHLHSMHDVDHIYTDMQ